MPDVRDALERALPARVNRIEVRDGEILYRDLTAPRDPQIWVHDLEIAVENIATREERAGGRPVTVSGSAKLGRSGDITLFVSANPFAKQLEFAGKCSVEGWKAAELSISSSRRPTCRRPKERSTCSPSSSRRAA